MHWAYILFSNVTNRSFSCNKGPFLIFAAGGGVALLYASKGLVDEFKERGQIKNFDQQVHQRDPSSRLPLLIPLGCGV